MTRDRDASPGAPWFLDRTGRQPVLTEDRIVEVAHDIVHGGGIDALSLRALARELRVGTSAIYRRIDKKEHLLVAVADLVLSEVQLAHPGARGWSGRLRELSLSVRATLERHPHIHPVLASSLIVSPAMVAVADAAIGYLMEGGFRGGELVDAYNAWACYVFGSSVVEMHPRAEREERDRLRGWAIRYLRGLDPHRYGSVAAVLPDLENRAFAFRWDVGPLGPDGRSFEVGLRAMMEGLASGAAKPSKGAGR